MNARKAFSPFQQLAVVLVAKHQKAQLILQNLKLAKVN
jgi:hypothetical protein